MILRLPPIENRQLVKINCFGSAKQLSPPYVLAVRYGLYNYRRVQAKASIALVFSSKLQDIFDCSRQGAWSAHPKCQQRQVLQVLPVSMLFSTTGRKILEVHPRKNSLAVMPFSHFITLHCISPTMRVDYMHFHNLKPFSQSFVQFLRIYCNALEGMLFKKICASYMITLEPLNYATTFQANGMPV